MSPLDRAKRATEAAERASEAGDHTTARAYRAAAASWERLARPGSPWSHEPARQQLQQLKRELAVATGPFQPPTPPKAPPPSRAELTRRIVQSVEHLAPQPTTIEF